MDTVGNNQPSCPHPPYLLPKHRTSSAKRSQGDHTETRQDNSAFFNLTLDVFLTTLDSLSFVCQGSESEEKYKWEEKKQLHSSYFSHLRKTDAQLRSTQSDGLLPMTCTLTAQSEGWGSIMQGFSSPPGIGYRSSISS